MEHVKGRDLFGSGPSKEIPCLTGAGKPTTATVGAVGCLYMNTDTGDLYKCTAAVDGVYTWEPAGSSLYYTPVVTQPTDNTLKFEFKPSVTGAPIPKAVTVELPTGNGSGQNGLTTEAAKLLITILEAGFYITDQTANIAGLEAALGGSGGSDDGGDSGGSSDPTGIDIPPENLLGYYDMRTALTGSSHITDLSGNGRDILFYPDNGYYADGCLYRGDKLSSWDNPAAEYGITDGAAGKYAYGENITFFVTFANSLSGTTPLVNLGSSPNTHKQMLVFQKGIILYRQAGFNDVSGPTKLTENVRTTVCAVITPTEEKIYINGVLKSSSAAKTSEYGDGFRLLTGYSNSSADADTKIFNAAVYDAALTDTEIAAISATLLKNAGGDA